MSCTRMAVVMTAALTFLRIVIGLHFFLEGAQRLINVVIFNGYEHEIACLLLCSMIAFRVNKYHKINVLIPGCQTLAPRNAAFITFYQPWEG